jgi:hypothetical protein
MGVLAASVGLLLAGAFPAAGQETAPPVISHVVNRSMSVHAGPPRPFVRLDVREGDGLAHLAETTFSTGVLEFRVRGEDAEGRSFVGVAFNVQNDSTYEAVYLRPFNFRTEDPARRLRAVQYMAQPEYPWNRLREESPGRYEAPARGAPDPDSWVLLRLVVSDTEIQVHVDGSELPDLVVERLGAPGEGGVALWVGNGSGGDFALGEPRVSGGRPPIPALSPGRGAVHWGSRPPHPPPRRAP